MNEDFWKALINGMTPETPTQVNLWWQMPLVMVVALIVAGMTCK